MSPADGALLAAIILLAYTAQAITGFGSTVLTITLSALFLPIALIMPIAVALNIPFCAWLLWRERSSINWRLLRGEILPLMAVGVFIGAASASALSGINLKRPLGAIIMVLAALELQRLYAHAEYHPHVLLKRGLILASGFMQGLYATGGPLLASAMAGSGLTRPARRATMTTVWLVFNLTLTVHYVIDERFTPSMTLLTLLLLPITGFGLWLGIHLHDRINENQFRLLVNLLLLISGAALIQ